MGEWLWIGLDMVLRGAMACCGGIAAVALFGIANVFYEDR